MTSLLDVNVLIGLLDVNHETHQAAMSWWIGNDGFWATCPITQNGYVQIVTREKYPNTISVNEAIKKLTSVVATPKHKFLHDDIALVDPQHFAHQRIQGPGQITDSYLLALSVHHNAQFVTFDTKISTDCIAQATDNSIYVITP